MTSDRMCMFKCHPRHFMALLFAVLAILSSLAKTCRAEANVVVEHVEEIHADGTWNGRPGLVFWKDRYRLAFRSGAEHSSLNGRIRMLTSVPNEPHGWTVSEVMDTPHDDAESHLLPTKDRLFVYVPLEDANTKLGDPMQTMMSFTEDGMLWSEPTPVYEHGFSLWKPVTHDGTHYVAADIMTGERRVELLQSKDGIHWQKVSTILTGAYTETALLFLPDNTLMAVSRQGKVSLAAPPYEDFKVYSGINVGGPAAALVGKTILVSGRTSNLAHPDDQPGNSRTGLYLFDRATKEFHHQMNMLTKWGGDDSYPHFLTLDDQRVLMTWYTGEGYERGVAKQANLYLARLRIE